MTVSFMGWKERAATFEADEELKAGSVAKVSGSGEVSACSAGDKFAGIVLSCRGGFAAVQLEGYAEVPYTGTAPSAGYQPVSYTHLDVYKRQAEGHRHRSHAGYHGAGGFTG